ncbi:MAG: FxLYD domain-containing protein, partial [Brevundimonas sp.]
RAAQAYAAVGLTVNPTGLDFEAVSAKPLPSDPGKVLVSGALRNVRDNERTAPPVRVALLDAQGAEIGHAVVRIDAAPVLPGKVQGFAAVIADPGARGQGIGVDFVLDAPEARPETRPPAPVRTDSRRAAPPAIHEPSSTALHEASAAGLRPALSPGSSAPMDMQPIDAVPVVDTHGVEAVSASNG